MILKDMRTILKLALASACLLLSPALGLAQGVAVLEGTVVDSGKPVAGIAVRAAGNNAQASVVSDRNGRFVFTTLLPGSYVLSAINRDRRASIGVVLPAGGTNVTIDFGLKTIGSVFTRVARPSIRGSGTDLTLTPGLLAHSVAATTFPNLLLQLPGSARGANGVVHINGDHGDIAYVVDGMPVPQELNRIVGNEFDLSDAAFVDVIQGAYPAQYGGKFASVLEVSTREGAPAAGYSASLSSGSIGEDAASVGYHDQIGKANFVLSLRGSETARGLDPPDLGSPVHDDASDTNEFLRVTLPATQTDYFNFDAGNSRQTFQIPNDVAGGEPLRTDDNETQSDSFASLNYHHALSAGASLSLGLSYKRSRIRDFGDPANDFTYGEALYAASGGSPDDCANALTRNNFGPATCAYSLNGDRLASDYGTLASYAAQTKNHAVRAGVYYDATLVDKTYAVTLQPGNFLAPIYSPAMPGSAYTVVDNAPNVGHTESAYVQDTWKIDSNYELQYGLREDAFQLFSTQFSDGASQLSPRVKLTRFLGSRASVYAYYGRFFTPFSFENVSPGAAQLLNLPNQPSVAAFDLKPQRDSDYELGGHLALGGGDLGLRVMQKNAGDLIDDTQVGVTALHQDINYQLGRIATQTAYFQHALARDGRFYVSMNHTYSVNKGCETQLLAPCFGSPSDWTPADHEQRWGANAGVLRNGASGGWFSADAEYGSGLSSAGCASTVAVCKYTPHTVFDAEQGIRLTATSTLVLRLQNVLNDRYFITYLNAQGNHVSQGRTLEAELRLDGPPGR